jgi:chromosome segregation ATPase
LTLRNGSSEAYKPLEYGNSITITCTIKRDGGTSYKIKSHSNHIIASSKEELLRIVNQFNIQVSKYCIARNFWGPKLHKLIQTSII